MLYIFVFIFGACVGMLIMACLAANKIRSIEDAYYQKYILDELHDEKRSE